jgi:hypothetical protein
MFMKIHYIKKDGDYKIIFYKINLLYIVRQHFYEYLHIAPFENYNDTSNNKTLI